MYINSKHLQILHLVKNNPDFNLKDLSEILDLSQQHIKPYLNDIYKEISGKNSSSLKIDEILKEISHFQGAKKILRKSQQFTKNQKIFYLLFFLIKHKKINFSNISKELDLTTRNLNNYKETIKNILNKYNLRLAISSQGIKLQGSNFNLKRLHYFLFFKFIIEKDYLPYKFRKDVLNSLTFSNFSKLNNDISNLLNLLNSQHSTHQQATLLSLHISFRGEKHEKTVKEISINQCLKYKPGYWSKEFFYRIFNFLKNSSFNELRAESLYLLFNVIDTFYCSKPCFSIFLVVDSEAIQNIFSKYFGEHVLNNLTSISIANQWIYYCKLKELFFIDDFSLINLNLTHIPNSNVLSMTKEIKKIIPSFTIFEGIFLWLIFSKSESCKDVNIFVFKNIENSIVPTIINEIYKKHNIKILEAISSKKVSKYLRENKVDNIITVENIKIYDKNITVKNLYFPVPNYKKIDG